MKKMAILACVLLLSGCAKKYYVHVDGKNDRGHFARANAICVAEVQKHQPQYIQPRAWDDLATENQNTFNQLSFAINQRKYYDACMARYGYVQRAGQ